MLRRAVRYDVTIDDSKGNVLINCLNATSMRNQANLVAKLLKANKYEPKFSSSISVADVGIASNVGFLWMQLCSFEFLGSEVAAYLATDKPKAVYVTIEGIPSKANVLYSNLPRIQYITVSDFVAKMLSKVGLRAKARVHHGVDLDAVNKAKQVSPKIRKFLDDKLGDTVKILYVGRNDPRKGLPKLAEANRILLEKGITTYHLIMKTEPSAKSLFPEDNVVFVDSFGSTGYIETLALMHACDYLVFPSVSEGFGLPVLEANAVGKPVIHCWMPPLVEFSSKQFNFVFGFDSVEMHQNAYRQFWIMHDYSPEYLAEMMEVAIDTYFNKKDEYEEYCTLAEMHASEWDYRIVYSDLLELMGLDIEEPSEDNGG